MKTSRLYVGLIITLAFIVVGQSGCLKKLAIHPGSISSLDSYAYDLLLVEQDSINQARALYLSNSLPATAKVPLNDAIKQYNVTLAAWSAYHATTQGADKLQQALDSLVAAVGEVQKILNKKATPAVPAKLRLPEDLYVYNAYTYAT